MVDREVRRFDAYIVVDWSANSSPARGKDSIWIAWREWRDGHCQEHLAENPSTRHAAAGRVRELLVALIARQCRVLVGFDFPYGYPAGLAAALGYRVDDGAPAPWEDTWKRLLASVRDDESNLNNRFEVAARLNDALGSPFGAFWGCPAARSSTSLSARCGAFPYKTPRGVSLEQYRHTESALRQSGSYVQETWKLFGAGCVGSQALVGIPRVASLRWDAALAPVSAVWPFETGFTPDPTRDGALIIHAEIWPGIIRSAPADRQVNDEAQVLGLTQWMADRDAAGDFGRYFDRPAALSADAALACVREEGWILGATPREPLEEKRPTDQGGEPKSDRTAAPPRASNRKGRSGESMPDSIFSTYRTGENRVTASILAVLRSLALHRTERLLGALMERSEFQLVSFQNQVGKGGKGVPDAAITASCRLLVETKIERNAVQRDQLERHLERLNAGTEADKVLLVLTPDDSVPAPVAEKGDLNVAWASFLSLHQAIEELLNDPREVISEREAFLMRELQGMLAEEGLVSGALDVVVVPARNAWPEYLAFHAYVCQPNRAFQGVRRVAFYTDGAIQRLVPTILETRDEILFEPGQNEGALGALVDRMVGSGKRERGQLHKVMLLSSPDDPETLTLDGPVRNDLTGESGRPTAFTQNQRYVSEAKLRTARVTSEVIGSR